MRFFWPSSPDRPSLALSDRLLLRTVWVSEGSSMALAVFKAILWRGIGRNVWPAECSDGQNQGSSTTPFVVQPRLGLLSRPVKIAGVYVRLRVPIATSVICGANDFPLRRNIWRRRGWKSTRSLKRTGRLIVGGCERQNVSPQICARNRTAPISSVPD